MNFISVPASIVMAKQKRPKHSSQKDCISRQRDCVGKDQHAHVVTCDLTTKQCCNVKI